VNYHDCSLNGEQQTRKEQNVAQARLGGGGVQMKRVQEGDVVKVLSVHI
jgi:hypothetical protein